MEKKLKMPWEDRPAGSDVPIWRYSGNPIIKRNPTVSTARVYNSAFVEFNGEFVGVFRGDGKDGVARIYAGRSKDGINFEIDNEPLKFVDEQGKPVNTYYQYDPRLIELEGKYYVVWCDEFANCPSLGVAYTTDFKTFVKLDHPFLPYNRNGVLFPKKINGYYAMLNRPSDGAHTRFGDIYISYSPDLKFWGMHRQVLKSGGCEWWRSIKVGAGPVPIETDEGWLVFIHGVGDNCNGMVYSIGAIVLDKDDPTKIKYDCSPYLMTPEETYEVQGFTSNVIFPTCSLVDKETGRIAIYYGAADTYSCIAFTTIDIVMDYIKKHSR